MHRDLFHQVSVIGHLCCFQYFAFKNTASVNNFVYILGFFFPLKKEMFAATLHGATLLIWEVVQTSFLSTNLGPRKLDFTTELYDSEHNYGFLWVSVFWSAIQKSWHLHHNMIVRILWVSIHNVVNIMPQRSPKCSITIK